MSREGDVKRKRWQENEKQEKAIASERGGKRKMARKRDGKRKRWQEKEEARDRDGKRKRWQEKELARERGSKRQRWQEKGMARESDGKRTRCTHPIGAFFLLAYRVLPPETSAPGSLGHYLY
jgi:hypothetical protein